MKAQHRCPPLDIGIFNNNGAHGEDRTRCTMYGEGNGAECNDHRGTASLCEMAWCLRPRLFVEGFAPPQSTSRETIGTMPSSQKKKNTAGTSSWPGAAPITPPRIRRKAVKKAPDIFRLSFHATEACRRHAPSEHRRHDRGPAFSCNRRRDNETLPKRGITACRIRSCAAEFGRDVHR